MPQDKYSAVWVSHSSMGDFIKCPRAYYLKNVYKDPTTRRKISIITPALTLGVTVHEVLEGLGDYPSEERMQKRNLQEWLDTVWEKYHGLQGGFSSAKEEAEYKQRGHSMIETVIKNPRFLTQKRIKLPRGEMNPNFFLDDEETIILNGLIDWIEYKPDTDSLHIIDFKTGKYEESEQSLQLPIYLLLCNALQKRPVTAMSYWYLENDSFVTKDVPDKDDAKKSVLAVAMKVKEARVTNTFLCPQGSSGCVHCKPFEKILAKDLNVIHVGLGGFNQDMYVIKK